MEESWQIFICYRQVDGMNTARWLFESLNKRSLPSAINTQREPPWLAVYFDQAVNQQCTKIDIAAFADPEEPRLAACRMFAGDEAEPGRQLAAVFELGGLADRGDERGGRHRPDPWDGL
jgi:hypothetical protein